MNKPGSQIGISKQTGEAAASENKLPSIKANVAIVNSEELLGARGELKIQHNGEQYSLRRTRQGKLILTK